MNDDQVTILRAHSGLLTKRIARNGDAWTVEGYVAGKFFSMHPTTVSSFGDLALVLTQTTRNPRLGIVRGSPDSSADVHRCQRRCDRSVHGNDVTLNPMARRWIAIDIDSLPVPAGVDFASNPEAGVEHALSLLPGQFRKASCWWQATSSAGIKPGIRCRMWFWLSRKMSDVEAKGWMQWSPADRSLYSAATLHYIAEPVLADGTHSPVARRFGIRRGEVDTVQVPAFIMPLASRAVQPVTIRRRRFSEADRAGLDDALNASRTAMAIWTGARRYDDRSSAHFALGAALARAGMRDPDLLAAALIEYDRRSGNDLSKVSRQAYLQRTVGAVLAV